jgi:CSLREA domain-containing protein
LIAWLALARRRRRGRVAAGAACALGCLTLAAGAQAAQIAVDIEADTVAADNHCSLREAITSANNDAPPFMVAGECAAGAVSDVVTLVRIPSSSSHAVAASHSPHHAWMSAGDGRGQALSRRRRDNRRSRGIGLSPHDRRRMVDGWSTDGRRARDSSSLARFGPLAGFAAIAGIFETAAVAAVS